MPLPNTYRVSSAASHHLQVQGKHNSQAGKQRQNIKEPNQETQKKCRQVTRILIHLRDQIAITESNQIAHPSDWFLEQLVNNALYYNSHFTEHDWHSTIYQTLQTIVNYIDHFRIDIAGESSAQKLLFPNNEQITSQQVKVFALRLLNLMDYKEHQFK